MGEGEGEGRYEYIEGVVLGEGVRARRGEGGGCLCLQVLNREVDRYFFKVFLMFFGVVF